MDDAGLVRGAERVADLRGDVQGAPGVEHALAREELRQRLALQVLHDEEVIALGRLPEVVDLDDVLVADLGDRTRLLVEARDHFLVAGELAVDDLERDLLADHRVLGEIDRSHAAGPDAIQDPVIADLLAFGDSHVFRSGA